MAEPYRSELITKKADLANWLCLQLKASSYLELATASTGFQFALVSRTLFSTVHRALYRLPAGYDDGLPVTFPSASGDSQECKAAILASGHRYDVVFIDPWHSYESSRQDLELGLDLLAPGGVLVVHDCHPDRAEIAQSEHREGEWMGVTYLAFLDLMRDRPELDYCVADMDYGCAVIWRRRPGTLSPPRSALLSSCNYRDWDTYFANRKELLNLLPTPETLTLLRRRPLTRIAPAVCRLQRTLSAKRTAFFAELRRLIHAIRENRRFKKVIRITKRVTRQILGLPPIKKPTAP